MRSTAQRRADVLDRLESDRDVWIATVDRNGGPHMIPVSLCWHRQQILVATGNDRPLARNVVASDHVRLGLGDGEDVVLIDAIASVGPWSLAEAGACAAFVDRTGWDPGGQPGEWVLLRLVPSRIRAWRTVAENRRGSVVMREGKWSANAR